MVHMIQTSFQSLQMASYSFLSKSLTLESSMSPHSRFDKLRPQFSRARSHPSPLNRFQDYKKKAVKKAEQKPEKTADERARSVFVGNLPAESTGEHIEAFFKQFGMVECVDVPPAKKGRMNRCFCFVTFTETSVVESVLESKHYLPGHPDFELNLQRMTTPEDKAINDAKKEVEKASRKAEKLAVKAAERRSLMAQTRAATKSQFNLATNKVEQCILSSSSSNSPQRPQVNYQGMLEWERKRAALAERRCAELSAMLKTQHSKRPGCEYKQCYQCKVIAECVSDDGVLDMAYCVKCWAGFVKGMRQPEARTPVLPWLEIAHQSLMRELDGSCDSE